MTSARKVMKLGLGFPDKEEVDNEIGNNTGHTIFRLGNQVVPDKEPTGTTKTMERGAEGRV